MNAPGPDYTEGDQTSRGVNPDDDMVVPNTQPIDDRDDEDPEFEVDPELSCTNTDFGEFDR